MELTNETTHFSNTLDRVWAQRFPLISQNLYKILEIKEGKWKSWWN